MNFNFKKTAPFILILTVLFISGTKSSFAATDVDLGKVTYTLLEPLPFIVTPGQASSTTPLDYIPGLLQLAIGIAGVLAVLRIIYGGFQYISADGFGAKSSAKETIQNSLLGLLLAIGAYSILYTLNSKLVNLDLSLESIPLATTLSTDLGGEELLAPPESENGCGGCIYVTSQDFPQKPPGPPRSGNIGCLNTLPEKKCQVSSSMATRLTQLAFKMQRYGVPWQVTEMYPPTVNHMDDCHDYGTCIDAKLINPNSDKIYTFLTEVRGRFGSFVYEACGSRLVELQKDPKLSEFKSNFKCYETTTGENIHIES